jgi:hypothetical protein
MYDETEGDSQGTANLEWGLQVLLWSCWRRTLASSESRKGLCIPGECKELTTGYRQSDDHSNELNRSLWQS